MDVREAIEEAAKEYRHRGEKPNAELIREALQRTAKYRGRVPTSRTIRSIAAEVGPDTSEPWRATRSSVDASLVLPTLAVLIEQARRTQLSVREAELIAAIRGAAPSVDALAAYDLARAFIVAENEANIESLTALDALLAFGPWNSRDAMARYEKVVLAGTVEVTSRPAGMDPKQWLDLQLRSIRARTERVRGKRMRHVDLAKAAGAHPEDTDDTKVVAPKRARKVATK